MQDPCQWTCRMYVAHLLGEPALLLDIAEAWEREDFLHPGVTYPSPYVSHPLMQPASMERIFAEIHAKHPGLRGKCTGVLFRLSDTYQDAQSHAHDAGGQGWQLSCGGRIDLQCSVRILCTLTTALHHHPPHPPPPPPPPTPPSKSAHLPHTSCRSGKSSCAVLTPLWQLTNDCGAQ
jgi:hypothetical protein